MSTQNQVSLKLIIDKKGQRILYGEADKKFVDFLFTILSLPVGTVIRLLSTEGMVGPLGKLYSSVDALNINYFEPNQHKDNLLKPMVPTTTRSQVGNLLKIESSASTIYYLCSRAGGSCANYSATCGTRCPTCNSLINRTLYHVAGTGEVKPIEGGYVKGMVSYMVMDDLTVKPMSSMSTISVLNDLNVEDVAQIEEKLIYLGMNEGVKLLRASLHSPTVLTDVFLHKIDFSTRYGPDVEEEVPGLWTEVGLFILGFVFVLICFHHIVS